MNNAQTQGETKKKVNRICKIIIIIITEARRQTQVEAKKRVKRITESHPSKNSRTTL